MHGNSNIKFRFNLLRVSDMYTRKFSKYFKTTYVYNSCLLPRLVLFPVVGFYKIDDVFHFKYFLVFSHFFKINIKL